MKLEIIGNDSACVGGHCPTVYLSDRGSLVIQGYRVNDPLDFELPAGETVVEVPINIIKDLLRSGRLG